MLRIAFLQAFYSRERQQQMVEALRVLDEAPAGNVLFAGGRVGASVGMAVVTVCTAWCSQAQWAVITATS
jgi:hypothetical protein